MRKLACILAFIATTAGCAGVSEKQKAYIAGAVAKSAVNTAHEVYSKKLNERVDQCDPETNAAIETVRQFDECLGPYAHNEKVVIALGIYRTAAVALFELLRAAEISDKDQVVAAQMRMLNAAFELLELIPEAEPYVTEIQEVLEIEQ